MPKQLSKNDLLDDAQSKIYVQDYTKKETIDGVKLVDLPMHTGEEGYFAELLRFNPDGGLMNFTDFKLAQVNTVKMYPGTVKAWHLHLRQDEIWCVMPDSSLLVGLWDLRKDSGTANVSCKYVLGEGKLQFLYIPAGVAHGLSVVSSKKVDMLYFVTQTFDAKNPDELRLPWDSLGREFWDPQRN